MWSRTLALLLVSSCYEPQLRDCVIACSAATDCVEPLVCGSDGLCAVPALAGRCASVTSDAAVGDGPPVDARLIDAPPIDAPIVDAPPSTCVQASCAAGGGTCASGRCVIDRDNPGSVTCPPGMPCTVICDAGDACKQGVSCALATSCIVECTGENACQDRGVDCGSAMTCEVTCRGSNACQHGHAGDRAVECRSATCSVTCDGDNACQDGVDVDAGGACAAHCCGDNACEGGTDTCSRDSTCS